MEAKWIGILTTMVVSVFTGGCLMFDRIDTLYLEPGGAVTWSVIHKDVRSDATSASERQDEEVPYLLAVQAQNHDLARGFWQLTPLEVRTRLLRSTAPYTVMTEARFPSLAVLGDRLIGRFGLEGTSIVGATAEGTRWTLTVRESASHEAGTQEDPVLDALVPELDQLVVVLGAGRFVDAQGFALSGDRRLARFVGDPTFEAKVREGAEIVVSLTWR